MILDAILSSTRRQLPKYESAPVDQTLLGASDIVVGLLIAFAVAALVMAFPWGRSVR